MTRELATLVEIKRPDSLAPGITKQLKKTKAALDKYKSVEKAKADGYIQASPCEELPSLAGVPSSYSGLMGFHYVSQAAMADGKIDPVRPEILLHAPAATGLQLVGVEYFKPDADGRGEHRRRPPDHLRPRVRRTDVRPRGWDAGPLRPARMALEGEPSGLFNPWNPDLSCKARSS